MKKVEINTVLCKACALCVRACPKGILALGEEINAGGYNYAVVTNEAECISCGNCGVNCPDRVLTVFKEENHG